MLLLLRKHSNKVLCVCVCVCVYAFMHVYIRRGAIWFLPFYHLLSQLCCVLSCCWCFNHNNLLLHYCYCYYYCYCLHCYVFGFIADTY